MRTRAVHRKVLLVLTGSILLQFGGCFAGLASSAFAVAEQVVLSQLYANLPFF